MGWGNNEFMMNGWTYGWARWIDDADALFSFHGE